MKAFFTASQRGKKYFDEYYEQIYNILMEEGYKVVDDVIVKVSEQEFYNKLSAEGLESYRELYERNTKAMRESDVNIFECSLPSLSIGFMIQKSLDEGKPTVVLYVDDNVPQFLAGIEDERLIIVNYKKEDLKDKLRKALVESQQKMDKRFNFFISPDLLNYIDAASKKMQITKSTLIRNLIIEHMRKSKAKTAAESID